MSEMAVFLQLLDEKMIDRILIEFFSDNNPKHHVNVKKIKLQKLLREPTSNKMKKIYRNKGESCIQVIIRELANKDLLNCDIETFTKEITSSKKDTLSNLELFCTAYVNFPDIMKENLKNISSNCKENVFLFKGIDAFNISSDYLDSLELSNLKKDIKLLKFEIEKIKLEAETIKNENNKLNILKNELTNENKKFKKDIKKYENDLLNINEDNINLRNRIKEKEGIIIEKQKINKDLLDKNKQLEKEKAEIISKYKEMESREFLELNDNNLYTEYSSCLIYTTSILATRSLFRNILFKSYSEYIKDSDNFIKTLKKLNIKDVYIMSNISMRELGTLKRKIKKEGMNYKTLLFSSELDMVEELLQNIKNNENINLIYT